MHVVSWLCVVFETGSSGIKTGSEAREDQESQKSEPYHHDHLDVSPIRDCRVRASE